jgi:hypothetical protein
VISNSVRLKYRNLGKCNIIVFCVLCANKGNKGNRALGENKRNKDNVFIYLIIIYPFRLRSPKQKQNHVLSPQIWSAC